MVKRTGLGFVFACAVCAWYVVFVLWICGALAGSTDNYDYHVGCSLQVTQKWAIFQSLGSNAGGVYLTGTSDVGILQYPSAKPGDWYFRSGDYFSDPRPNWANLGFDIYAHDVPQMNFGPGGGFANGIEYTFVVVAPDWFIVLAGLVLLVDVLRRSATWRARLKSWPWYAWWIPAFCLSLFAVAAACAGDTNWVVAIVVMAVSGMIVGTVMRLALLVAFKADAGRGFAVVVKPPPAVDDAKPKSGA